MRKWEMAIKAKPFNRNYPAFRDAVGVVLSIIEYSNMFQVIACCYEGLLAFRLGYWVILFEQQNDSRKDILGDYDFSRSDKLFVLKVPTFRLQDGVAYYQFNLRDLIHNQTYVSQFRYNQLKNIHEILAKLNFELPPFPVTHFWVKTNSNPELIEKRRAGLQAYFSRIINDPYLRGYKQVKRIITMCKKNCAVRRRMSGDKKTQKSWGVKRSVSESKSKKGETISKQQWRKLRGGDATSEAYIYYK